MTGKIIKGIAGFYYVYVEETKEAKVLKSSLPDLQIQKQFLEQQLQQEREKFEQEKNAAKIERERLEQEMAKLKFNYEFSKAALHKVEKELAEKQKTPTQNKFLLPSCTNNTTEKPNSSIKNLQSQELQLPKESYFRQDF